MFIFQFVRYSVSFLLLLPVSWVSSSTQVFSTSNWDRKIKPAVIAMSTRMNELGILRMDGCEASGLLSLELIKLSLPPYN